VDAVEVNELSALLSAAPNPWGFAGGWAIDLHLGYQSRDHDDLDVLVFDRDVDRFAEALATRLQLFGEKPASGERFDWQRGRALEPGAEALAAEVVIGKLSRKVQFLVARTDGDEWVYHRGRGITRFPLAEVFLDHGATRYVTPRLVLLFKSRQMRPKDDADFRAVSPALQSVEAAWLLDRVRRWQADHPWIEQLLEISRESA
jgi:hypothetical protein